MEINIVPHKPQNEIQIVKMPNKPSMALALESTKIREYPEEIKNKNTATLVDWLLNLIGVNSKEGGLEQHAVAFKHVNDTLGNFTYEEIKLAFEKYVNGELYGQDGKPIQAFSELNARVIGRVMAAYNELKQSELNTYYRLKREQKLKEVEKELSHEDRMVSYTVSILDAFDGWIEQKSIPEGYAYVYEILFELKLLPEHNQEYKKRIKNLAEKRAEIELKEERAQKGFRQIVNSLEHKQGLIKLLCKKIATEEYFAQFKDLEELKTDLRKVIKTNENGK